MATTATLKRLDRRYKACKILKWLLLVMSIICAVCPAVVVAFKIAPSVPKVKPSVGIASFALFILAIGLIFVIRGLEKRYAHKLPWATTALLWAWVLYCFLFAMEKVIAQSVQISLALAIGASVAFVLSLGSELCRVIEKNAEEEYKRLK